MAMRRLVVRSTRSQKCRRGFEVVQRREFWWLWRAPAKESDMKDATLKELGRSLKCIVNSQEEVVQTIVKSVRRANEVDMQNQREERQVALLIDAENCSHHTLPSILRDVQQYGSLSARRIYGDWTSSQLAGWKTRLLENAIIPIQIFLSIHGKNSSDAALIIDAMDLLHSGRYSVFVLVSSDSDFTRLATRIREDGKTVIGVGRKHTAKTFVNACHTFRYVEALDTVPIADSNSILQDNTSESKDLLLLQEKKHETNTESTCPTLDSSTNKNQKYTPKTTEKMRKRILSKLGQIIQDNADQDGWTSLSFIGTELREHEPDLDIKPLVQEGTAATLSNLLRSTPGYVLQSRGRKGDIFVRKE